MVIIGEKNNSIIIMLHEEASATGIFGHLRSRGKDTQCVGHKDFSTHRVIGIWVSVLKISQPVLPRSSGDHGGPWLWCRCFSTARLSIRAAPAIFGPHGGQSKAVQVAKFISTKPPSNHRTSTHPALAEPTMSPNPKAELTSSNAGCFLDRFPPDRAEYYLVAKNNGRLTLNCSVPVRNGALSMVQLALWVQ